MKKNFIFIFIFCFLLGGVTWHFLKSSVPEVYHPPVASTKPSVSGPERVMDRHLLSDTLIYIFGPASKSIVQDNLFDLGAPIGGGCDFYKMTYDKDQKVIDPFTRCPAGVRDINAAMFVPANALRRAAIDKTCRLLATKKETREHALTLANIKASVPVTEASFRALYFAFHKSPMTDDAQWKKSLSTDSQWSKTVYSLCTSPTWQTL